jgi:hypothetical protein
LTLIGELVSTTYNGAKLPTVFVANGILNGFSMAAPSQTPVGFPAPGRRLYDLDQDLVAYNRGRRYIAEHQLPAVLQQSDSFHTNSPSFVSAPF